MFSPKFSIFSDIYNAPFYPICCFSVFRGFLLRTKPARKTRCTLCFRRHGTPRHGCMETAEGRPRPPALNVVQPHRGGHRHRPPRRGDTAAGATGGAAAAGAVRSEGPSHPPSQAGAQPLTPRGSPFRLFLFSCRWGRRRAGRTLVVGIVFAETCVRLLPFR